MAFSTIYKVKDLKSYTLAADFLAGATVMSVSESLADIDFGALGGAVFLNIEDSTNGDEVVRATGKDTSTTPHKFTGITRAMSGSDVNHTTASVGRIAIAPTQHVHNPLVDRINLLNSEEGVVDLKRATAPTLVEGRLWYNDTVDLLEYRDASNTRRVATEGHTHVKANITDLETITTTPTVNAVPKARPNGKLAEGWLPIDFLVAQVFS